MAFLRDFCDGDEVQMRHFIQKFLDQYPLEIKRLEDALEQDDREALYQAAHSFKPQMEFVGLKNASTLSARLEQGARSGSSIGELSELVSQTKLMLSGLPPIADWFA
jgi:HPt (histidine-containing phosphotransfer) domain-containing protein